MTRSGHDDDDRLPDATSPGFHRYFAYGMNLDRDAMAQRCPDAVWEGVGFLADHAFVINSRGVATVVARAGEAVWGLLWRLRRSDEERLDRFEGVAGGFYTKERLEIRRRQGASTTALLYVATDSRPGLPIPGYLETIVESAAALDLPPDYQARLAMLHARSLGGNNG